MDRLTERRSVDDDDVRNDASRICTTHYPKSKAYALCQQQSLVYEHSRRIVEYAASIGYGTLIMTDFSMVYISRATRRTLAAIQSVLLTMHTLLLVAQVSPLLFEDTEAAAAACTASLYTAAAAAAPTATIVAERVEVAMVLTNAVRSSLLDFYDRWFYIVCAVILLCLGSMGHWRNRLVIQRSAVVRVALVIRQLVLHSVHLRVPTYDVDPPMDQFCHIGSISERHTIHRRARG